MRIFLIFSILLLFERVNCQNFSKLINYNIGVRNELNIEFIQSKEHVLKSMNEKLELIDKTLIDLKIVLYNQNYYLQLFLTDNLRHTISLESTDNVYYHMRDNSVVCTTNGCATSSTDCQCDHPKNVCTP
jgi:hypothetical protein